MSDIKMIVKLCIFEHVPVEDSEFHRTLIAMGMEDASDRLSYEREWPGEAECGTYINSSTISEESRLRLSS